LNSFDGCGGKESRPIDNTQRGKFQLPALRINYLGMVGNDGDRAQKNHEPEERKIDLFIRPSQGRS
jgi:hypothetical protein